MNTLTDYRRPQIRYGLAQARHGRWIPRGGWYLTEGGSQTRVYGRNSRRTLTARRAVIENVGGWWRWHVEVFELDTRAVLRICARGVNGYMFARQAMPFADLAARTAD